MQQLPNARDLPQDLGDLVRRYGDIAWDHCHWLHRNTEYRPGYWEKSMRTQEALLGVAGPLQASLNLIRNGGGTPQKGYLTLLEMGEVKRSVEYEVLRMEWRPIFSYFPDVMDLARSILRRSDVIPPDEGGR
jgi:hypothetical protein